MVKEESLLFHSRPVSTSRSRIKSAHHLQEMFHISCSGGEENSCHIFMSIIELKGSRAWIGLKRQKNSVMAKTVQKKNK